MPLLLRNCEDHVKAQHLPPPKPSEYARAQMAFLGYTEPMGVAGKGLLYVTSDVRQLISKKNNKPWARSFSAVSLADGSAREWTIREQDYCDQFVKGDILRVIPRQGAGNRSIPTPGVQRNTTAGHITICTGTNLQRIFSQ